MGTKTSRAWTLGTAFLVFLSPAVSEGRTQVVSDYSFEQVWNAAVRLVRVDLGFSVTEKDADGGYVLFQYQGELGPSSASIEVLRMPEGRVGVICQVAALPRYVEIHLLDRLQRKLREDFGNPLPRRPVRSASRSPAGQGDTPGQRPSEGDRTTRDREPTPRTARTTPSR